MCRYRTLRILFFKTAALINTPEDQPSWFKTDKISNHTILPFGTYLQGGYDASSIGTPWAARNRCGNTLLLRYILDKWYIIKLIIIIIETWYYTFYQIQKCYGSCENGISTHSTNSGCMTISVFHKYSTNDWYFQGRFNNMIQGRSFF